MAATASKRSGGTAKRPRAPARRPERAKPPASPEPDPEPIGLSERQRTLVEARAREEESYQDLSLAGPPPNPHFIVVGGPPAPPAPDEGPAPEAPPEAPVAGRLREVIATIPDVLDAGALMVIEAAAEEIERLLQEHETHMAERRKVAKLWKAEREELQETKRMLQRAQEAVAKMRAAMERSQTPIIDGLIAAATAAVEDAILEAGAELKRGLSQALDEELFGKRK